MSSNTPPGSPPMDKNERDVRRSVHFSSNRAMFEQKFQITDLRTFKPTRTSLTDDDKTKMKESGFIAPTSSSIPIPPPPPLTYTSILEPNPDYSPEISPETPSLTSDPSSHDLKPIASEVLTVVNNDQAKHGQSSKVSPIKPPRNDSLRPRETFAQTVKRAIFMPWTLRPIPVPRGK